MQTCDQYLVWIRQFANQFYVIPIPQPRHCVSLLHDHSYSIVRNLRRPLKSCCSLPSRPRQIKIRFRRNWWIYQSIVCHRRQGWSCRWLHLQRAKDEPHDDFCKFILSTSENYKLVFEVCNRIKRYFFVIERKRLQLAELWVVAIDGREFEGLSVLIDTNDRVRIYLNC